MALSRGLVAEVSHFVVLGLVSLEPGLEAELLRVAARPHHHTAQPELVTTTTRPWPLSGGH